MKDSLKRFKDVKVDGVIDSENQEALNLDKLESLKRLNVRLTKNKTAELGSVDAIPGENDLLNNSNQKMLYNGTVSVPHHRVTPAVDPNEMALAPPIMLDSTSKSRPHISQDELK